MISLQELNPHSYSTDSTIQENLNSLLHRINLVRLAWGKPMTVTSGLRSMEDQLRINPGALKSKHLIGAAVDILDRDGSLKAWLIQNPKILEDSGLWCEANTVGWVHFQVTPPKSGNRWFIP